MTQLTDNQHKALMADMKTFDGQMPSVGTFCYNPENRHLSVICKKELTPRDIEEAAEKGICVIRYPETYIKVDTLLNRGCVIWNTDKFEIIAGHWVEPILDELTELLEKEFSLPYFEFVYDEHWDLGHGWSGDMIGTR